MSWKVRYKNKPMNCPHKDRPHYAYGVCKGCYHNIMYNFDEDYRKKMKAKAKRFYEKRVKENPNWNKERQKEWREKNPRKKNYMLAKYYLKKLNEREKNKLFKELGIC